MGAVKRQSYPIPRLKLQFRGDSVLLSGRLGTFSIYDPAHLFTGYSWDCLSTAGTLLRQPPKRILLLGLGGGTVVRQCRYLYPEARIDAVEIDRQVVRSARCHFHLPRTGLRVFIGDSVQFLQRTSKRYDIILDDVWLDHPHFVKPIFADPSYSSLPRRRLTSGGAYCINLWSGPGRTSEIPSATKLLRPIFRTLVALRPPLGPTGVLCALRQHDISSMTLQMLRRRYLIRVRAVRGKL